MFEKKRIVFGIVILLENIFDVSCSGYCICTSISLLDQAMIVTHTNIFLLRQQYPLNERLMYFLLNQTAIEWQRAEQ